MEERVFIACVLFVGYTYVGYPALLWLISKLKAQRDQACSEPDVLPTVTVVIAAHNEESNIARRLENILRCEYPPEKLDIVVACDGCTDRTVQIAREYAAVTVLDLPRRGKAAALNDGVAAARGEVVVFTDARQRFATDAIMYLVKTLHCPRVGAVGGELVLLDQEGAPQSMGAYWSYEKMLRKLEARVSSPVQCSGAIYAIWRKHFASMPEGLVLDDMWIPLHVARAGYRMALEHRAKAYDTVTPTYDREFRRKVRTLAGNYQLMWMAPWLLLPVVNPLWWQFISHKVFRLLVPYALAGMYVASWALLHQPYGTALVASQSVFYLLGALAWAIPSLARRSRLVGLAGSFLSLNAAAAVAPVAFVLGRGRVKWERSPMMSPQTTGEEGRKVRTY
ncbi:MAG: glycosyltransferase family 2 protein [Chthonomonadetes bacterium]|nr:glycosyltransferase family 2 protein [Chthonomonadetes bacterium]